MNEIAKEILSYYGCASDEEFLEHYGMPRRSGRYPWGSGEDPYQHSRDFIGRVEEMRKNDATFYLVESHFCNKRQDILRSELYIEEEKLIPLD